MQWGLTRLALQAARRTWLQFHVLRTYRRAAGEKRKAEVNGKAWALHFEERSVTKCEALQKSRQKTPESLSKPSLGRPQTL